MTIVYIYPQTYSNYQGPYTWRLDFMVAGLSLVLHLPLVSRGWRNGVQFDTIITTITTILPSKGRFSASGF